MTEAEIQTLIHQFEAATLSMAHFHHREHLIVALWYASRYEPQEALGRIRTGLQRLLAANGKPHTAYREDITALWMQRAHGFLATSEPSTLATDCVAQWLLCAASYPAYSDCVDEHEVTIGCVSSTPNILSSPTHEVLTVSICIHSS